MIDLSPEARDAIGKIEKLLRLAGKNTSQAEASSAAAKAQELMTRYNLDMATVEQGSDSGKREDAKLSGGLYHYQRDLWYAVAELNFCLHWSQYVYDKDKTGRRKATRRDVIMSAYDDRPIPILREGQIIKVQGGYRFVHQVVGRKVNVAATRVMAEYLEQVIERLTRERLNGEGSQFFTRWAISYREGIASTIIDKIYQRRQHLIRAEQRKQREADKRAAEAAAAPFSSATALMLSDYVKSEHDANMDVVNGEGWSARVALARAEAAREAAEEEACYVAWAKTNPEEAAKQEAKEREARKKDRYRGGRADYRDRKQTDYGAYRSGEEAGKNVSLDQQTDDRRGRRAIG